MRLLAPGAIAFVFAAWAFTATAQDKQDACDQLGSIAEALTCWGAKAPTRPLDSEGGPACANLDALKFKRPAAGPRVMAFGERSQYGTTSKGVVIEAASEAVVSAPIRSIVTFANEYRSYGRLVVLEPGCGLQIILAGLARIDVAPGQQVATGEPLGLMAAAKGSGKPVLYVELRRDGRPINPGSDIAGD